MFRRRDEDEIEYTLQPANRTAASSGFAATNQSPGQMINTTHAPNNMPYNPAAYSLAQQQAQTQAPNAASSQADSPSAQNAPVSTNSRVSSPYQTSAEPSPRAEAAPAKEPKTSTKVTSSMNTFVPSAIRATSSSNQQPAQSSQQQQPAPISVPASNSMASQNANQRQQQQPLKVDNINLETERRLTVGYGISLEGKVSDCDKLVIYGNVNAELNNVKALQISDSGCFRGAAEIDYAEISGIFEGELRVRKNITISSTGRVSGKITYHSIEIKPGGKFTGEIIEAKTDSDNASGTAGSDQKPGEDFSLFSEQKVENRAA